jgi:Zn-dependent protease
VHTLYGIRFKPLAQVDGIVLGLDARWLTATGWGPIMLLGLLAVVISPTPDRWLAGVSIILAFLATSATHESGHVLASRAAGLRVQAVVLAPQGGATIHASSPVRSVNVLTALGGPLANALVAAVCLPILVSLGPESLFSPFFLELLGLQLLTAIVNLLPWNPMDGYRIFCADA